MKSFLASIILIEETEESLMMIWIRVFVDNTKTVADSTRSLSFHHTITVVNFVSIEEFFPTTVVKLFGFVYQAMISIWKTNSARTFFVD
jgi:hypothetical protein